MDSLHVDQAVFASSDRGPVKGYQLVARSAGIDKDSSQELCRWSPTQFPSSDADHWMLGAFRLANGRVAVTRTVLGGPEYSRRGAAQVVTLMLLLHEQQFRHYACNAIAVAKTALALGYLRLSLDSGRSELGKACLPERPIMASPPAFSPSPDSRSEPMFEQIRRLLSMSRRVAVAGLNKPIDAMARLLDDLPEDARMDLSFTTGLTPSTRRPFQVHFLDSVGHKLHHSLDSQRIVLLQAE